MAKLNKHLAIMALLAGTTLAVSPVYAQDQSGSGAMDQSQSTDGGGSSEELLKNQNQATSGEDATMPDAQQQDQAGTNEAQDPAAQTQDQATDDELLKQKNQSEDQAQSPRQDSQSEDQATDEDQMKQKKQSQDQAQSPENDDQNQSTADRDRRKDRNANQDTATDTRQKKTDETTAEGKMKTDENKDRAASDKPSNETTGSINISAEQKTVIKNTIVETKVKPVDVDFKVKVGVNVPSTVVLHPLPPKVIELVPAYRDYVYFLLADGTIVIVDPGSHDVVYVITA
jgi:hypothetical protein